MKFKGFYAIIVMYFPYLYKNERGDYFDRSKC